MAHRAGGEQPLEQRTVGIASRLGRVRPQPLGRDERPFEMRAEDARRRSVRRNLPEGSNQLVLGRCDERRLVGRDAALQQRLAGAPVAVGVGPEEVHTGEAVDLQVDEPGRRDALAVRRVEPDRRDTAVRHFDVTGNEAPVDERCPDAEAHL